MKTIRYEYRDGMHCYGSAVRRVKLATAAAWCAVLFIATLLCGLLTGCSAPTGAIYANKTTVFGLQIGQDLASKSPKIQLGLVRSFQQVVPTATNPVYAAPYASSVNADIRLTRQTVDEDFSTGGLVLPTNAVTKAKAKKK